MKWPVQIDTTFLALNYTITSNHIHLLVFDQKEEDSLVRQKIREIRPIPFLSDTRRV
jgi:hypothetical protein